MIHDEQVMKSILRVLEDIIYYICVLILLNKLNWYLNSLFIIVMMIAIAIAIELIVDE